MTVASYLQDRTGGEMQLGFEIKRTAPASGGFGWLRGQGGLSITKPHQQRQTRPNTATAASRAERTNNQMFNNGKCSSIK